MQGLRAAAAALIAAALMFGHQPRAEAQDFSGKTIRIIVGLAPGGGTDVTARLIAQRLAASLRANVYVETEPGGAFEPAYRELTGAAPDGRTLFFISTATVVAQPSTKDYPFDVRNMTAVTEVGRGPFILTARKELGFHDINDLVDYAKKNPGKLTFASGGGATGSFSLSVELLRLAAGISVVNVPYKGSAEALSDLLGGRIDAMFDATPIEIPQVKAGAVSGVAVTGRERAVGAARGRHLRRRRISGFCRRVELLRDPGDAGHAAGCGADAARRHRQGGHRARRDRLVRQAGHEALGERARRRRRTCSRPTSRAGPT